MQINYVTIFAFQDIYQEKAIVVNQVFRNDSVMLHKVEACACYADTDHRSILLDIEEPPF